MNRNELELLVDDLNSQIASKYTHQTSSLICQANGDCGDTLQRMSSYFICMKYLEMSTVYTKQTLEWCGIKTYSKLQKGPNKYTRATLTGTWQDETDRASRDQISITLIAQNMLFFNSTPFFIPLVKYLVNRKFFHDNVYKNWVEKKDHTKLQTPDIVSPSELGTMIRGLGLWYLYPVLCILDLDHVANTMVSLYFNKWDQSNMLIPNLIFSNSKYTTPLSWLAKKIATRNSSEIERQIRNYYSIEKNGIPPLGELIILAFKKLTGRL